MNPTDVEIIHNYYGRGKGGEFRVVHKPTGISGGGLTDNDPHHRLLERLFLELEDKVPPEGVKIDASWLSLPVRQLVAAIARDGTFDSLPILADALEEAGCDSADILDHLRGPGPHFQACWVLALLTRRE